MGKNIEEEINWITLVEENGTEHRFELLDIVEVDNQKYAVMFPEIQNTNEDETEAVIFRIEVEEDGKEVLVDIEDDDEFAKVVEIFKELENEEDELH
jgi:putative Holliday junction resolvase